MRPSPQSKSISRFNHQQLIRKIGCCLHFFKSAWRWGHAILPREFSHPFKIRMAFLDCEVKIYPRQFLAKGAHVEVALNLVKTREFLL